MIQKRPITLLKTLMHEGNQVTLAIKITSNLSTSLNTLFSQRYSTKHAILAQQER